MQPSRRRRAALGDAALALLFERCHYDGNEPLSRKDVCTSAVFDSAIVDSLLFGTSDESVSKTVRGSVVMTTMHRLTQEERDTEQQMRDATHESAARLDTARSAHYEHWASMDQD